MTLHTFNNLFLLGRPASGKSELIDYMKKCDPKFRLEKHFIGDLAFVDDFVWLWEKFEDDDIWEKVIGKRFFSKKHDCGYFNAPELFDYAIEKFNREISKKYLGNVGFYKNGTLIIEFARGGECPYLKALNNFKPEILKDGAILYVKVSGNESRRRNEARYQEKMKSSILAHKVPEDVMDRYYTNDDWDEITGGKEFGFVKFNGVMVPFVTMNNEPESKDSKVLAERYGNALKKLNNLWMDSLKVVK